MVKNPLLVVHGGAWAIPDDMVQAHLHGVRNAAAAGLRGVAFEANATILAEREACLAAADAAGLFLLGLDSETWKGDSQ